MKEKEFKNLKVGDKVQIVSNKVGDYWDPFGEMVKWLGKIMTIREVDSQGRAAYMEEDKNEMNPSMIIYIVKEGSVSFEYTPS